MVSLIVKRGFFKLSERRRIIKKNKRKKIRVCTCVGEGDSEDKNLEGSAKRKLHWRLV